MNTYISTPAMDDLRAFLDAAEGKVLTEEQHEMFRGFYILARLEQRRLARGN